jgi:hypothetical protein
VKNFEMIITITQVKNLVEILRNWMHSVEDTVSGLEIKAGELLSGKN